MDCRLINLFFRFKQVGVEGAGGCLLDLEMLVTSTVDSLVTLEGLRQCEAATVGGAWE